MTVRVTMSSLIAALRGHAAAGPEDYTSGGLTYWTDEQLQSALDRRRTDLRFYPLEALPDYAGGSVSYTEYRLPYAYLEQAPSVLDAAGNAYGTAAYTIDYDRAVVVFAANTAGAAVYLTGHVYDLYRAAADVWRQKAAYYAAAYDVSTDNHSLHRSQLQAQARAMAAQYEQMAGPLAVQIRRGDE